MRDYGNKRFSGEGVQRPKDGERERERERELSDA